MNKEDIVRLIRKSGKPSEGLDEALTKKVPDFSRTFNVGGRNRTRTCDPIDVNDVLYLCSMLMPTETPNIVDLCDSAGLSYSSGKSNKGKIRMA